MVTTRKTTAKKTSTKKTTKKPVDLFIGAFPGGILFADKNRIEHGDYKKLALVRYNGVIYWYVDKNKLPSDIIYQILQKSQNQLNNI